MRNRTLARVVAGALLALPVGACDFISPTESDPNAVGNATVDQLFTGIQVNSFYMAESQLARIAAMWTQQMTGTDRQFATLDNYVLNEEDADGEFSSVYTGGGLIDIRQAVAKAEADGRRVYAGILKIHEAYLIGMAASIFGDIPYSEAVTPGIDDPALDDQAAVYAAIQALLDEAIADLGSGEGAGPGGVDFNFGGDADAWIAVARTLKARYHMHLAETGGNAAYQAALTAAEGGISSPDGNWMAIHGTESTEQNLWYQFMRDRSGYVGSGVYMVPLLVAEDDPRLPFYFEPVAGTTYEAPASLLSEDGYGAEDFDIPIVSCAEAAYIRAEAQYQLGNQAAARTEAKEGLACQEAFWDVDLSTQAADLDAAAGAALLAEIMQQKYIALFLNIEAYNDYKRTCLPAIEERAAGMPGRLYYGQAERQSNENIPEVSLQPERNDNDPNPCS